MRSKRTEKALDCYLHLKRPDVFDFILQYQLEAHLAERVVLLLDFEEEERRRTKPVVSPGNENPTLMQETFVMRLLLENVVSMPVAQLVDGLQSRPAYLCRYLDGLFRKDATLAVEFHRLQPKLYAVHQPGNLLDFLRISTAYELEDALRVCEECGLLREQVYLLGRMGNSKKALGLIVNRIENVDMVGFLLLYIRMDCMYAMDSHVYIGHGICC